MPRYDYTCENCDNQFEIEKSYTDESKTKCPKCKSTRTKKMIYASPTIIYHGDGFTKSRGE